VELVLLVLVVLVSGAGCVGCLGGDVHTALHMRTHMCSTHSHAAGLKAPCSLRFLISSTDSTGNARKNTRHVATVT
jgi:hypothetical protein